MPDSQGNLSDAENRSVLQWLNEKWTQNRDCPISGDNNWHIGTVIIAGMLTDTRQLMGTSSYPAVPVVCLTCGYQIYFSATMLGLYGSTQGGTNA